MGSLLRPGLRRLFRLPLRGDDAVHADADEELESLIAARVEYLVARGLSAEDARAEALRRLGATLDDARRQLHHSAEQRERRMTVRETFESVVQDIRYAARGLVHRPGFSIVAVLTLAIGIGATTAIFSAVNVLLLRPLPYARPNELMKISLTAPARGAQPADDQIVWSYPKFTVFKNAQRVFSNLSLYSSTQLTLDVGDAERLRGEFVGATYFRTLGLPIVRGRDFDLAVDAAPGAPRQVILSYALWQQRFNANPAVVGRSVDLERNPYTVIGIAPPDFRGLTGQAQFFAPITTRPADDLNEPQSHEFWLVARRAPGVSVSRAAGAVALLGMRVNAAFPNTIDHGKWGAVAEPLDGARLAPAIRRSLLILFGAVGFVLLIACVNVANLLLGRANTRRREIAVRLAIGAGRARLMRLLLAESLLLSLVGAVASVGVAWISVRALGTINPASTLRMSHDSGLDAVAFSAISLDWRALGFTLVIAMIVGVLFGLAPAIGATRASFTGMLKTEPARGQGLRAAASGRQFLVVTEIALAVVLLAGSGLMIRSLTKLLAIDPGFDPRQVLTVRLSIPAGVPRDSMPMFYEELLDRVRAVPGVTDAALSSCAPLSGGCNATQARRLDEPRGDPARLPVVGIHWVTPTWFSTVHVPLKRGRVFASTDRAGMPKVVMIDEQAAKRIWPNEDPIGKRIEIGQGGLDDAQVIGIVGGVRQSADSEPRADVYASFFQSPRPGLIIFVRADRSPGALGADVRRAIHDLAPHYPIFDMLTLSERVAGATARERFSATLLALFAATALLLAAIGIYGVLSISVTARTREIGIRIALGAEQRRVRQLVIGEGIGLAGIGAVIGIAGALVSTRLLRTLLFDLTPNDPLTYIAIVVVLGAAVVLASWLPARRAARVDPVVALRAD